MVLVVALLALFILLPQRKRLNLKGKNRDRVSGKLWEWLFLAMIYGMVCQMLRPHLWGMCHASLSICMACRMQKTVFDSCIWGLVKHTSVKPDPVSCVHHRLL